ncbi:hypothetical protein LWI29_002435 [Acer saccharum]|uniref:Uncharacterized protein n=1 Tax=Acer saccharum TaxID=4024 RepID=A0AA39VHX4_ACESA|nr:hypothetical protein LWI29_002435 [Acer saccharum]
MAENSCRCVTRVLRLPSKSSRLSVGAVAVIAVNSLFLIYRSRSVCSLENEAMSLIFVVEFGFSWVVCGVLKPELSPEIVRSVSERSWIVQDLSKRLRFLQNKLMSIVVDGRVSNCSFSDSKWEINQSATVELSTTVGLLMMESTMVEVADVCSLFVLLILILSWRSEICIST